jgi:hypothetical protein
MLNNGGTMHSRKIIKSVLILAPVLLWGWGSDIVVETMRSSNNQYPAGYDVTWRDSTDMLVGIGFNDSDSNAYIYFYNSNDRGNSWSHVATAQWIGTKINGIQLLESPPYLVALWQGQGNRLGLTLHNRNNLNSYYGGALTESDSIVDAKIVCIKKGDTTNLYIVLVTRNTNSNTDVLKIYKSSNYSSFQQVFTQLFTNNTNFLFLKDLDATLNHDTTMLYLTLENLDRSNNKASLTFRILREEPSGNIINTVLGYPSQYSSPLNTSLGVSGPYALSLLQTDNDLKYVVAYEYFGNMGMYNFPYNSTDSVEWGPFVRGYNNNGNLGFHIIYSCGSATYGSKLYYVEATVNGNSIQFSPPVLVSNEIPVCKTPYNFQSISYNPKVATLKDEYIPVLIWSHDFWHLFYGSPFYDSTYFVIDKMEQVPVSEKPKQNIKLFSLNIYGDFIHLNLENITKGELKGEIYNIEGKLIESFLVPSGFQNFDLEIKRFKNGAYFIALKDKSSLLSVEKFLIW